MAFVSATEISIWEIPDRPFFDIEGMERQDFTDFDAFRTTIQQLDGGWLLNGGKDWRCVGIRSFFRKIQTSIWRTTE